MHCPSCGKASQNASANFCRYCGASLQTHAIKPTGAVPAVAPVAAPPQVAAPPPPSVPRTDQRPLQIEIENGNVFSTASVTLEPGQSIRAESGAMVSMSANVLLEAKAEGGIWAGIKRLAAQESFMQSTFSARGQKANVVLAPDLPGEIRVVELLGNTLIIQGSSYLAGHPSLSLDAKFSGMKGIFAGESLFFLHAQGHGQVLIASYGAISEKTLAPGERFVVDSGHIVAYDESAQMHVRKASERGLWQTMMSGEGLVAEFRGPGRVFVQTRSFADLWRRIAPYVRRMQTRAS